MLPSVSMILGQGQQVRTAVDASVQRHLASHATVQANLQHQRMQQQNVLLAAVAAAAPTAVPATVQTSGPSLAEQWGQLSEAQRREIRRSLQALSISVAGLMCSLVYVGKSPLTLI